MAAKQFPFATAPSPIGGAGGQWAINQAIPGLAGLTAGATGIINNALTGIPSPSESRLENAYFGAGSGLDPSSDFLRNRGYDLYKRKAQAQQRGGIQDLMSMIGAYSGNVAPTPGEQIGQQESTANRLQQGTQFQTQIDFEKQKYQDELKLLAELIGQTGVGTTSGGAAAPGATTAPGTTGAPSGTGVTGTTGVSGGMNSILDAAVPRQPDAVGTTPGYGIPGSTWTTGTGPNARTWTTGALGTPGIPEQGVGGLGTYGPNRAPSGTGPPVRRINGTLMMLDAQGRPSGEATNEIESRWRIQPWPVVLENAATTGETHDTANDEPWTQADQDRYRSQGWYVPTPRTP